VVEDRIAFMHAMSGPEGRFIGTVTADRLDRSASSCALTLTPTTAR
jgi:hypothetical protein